MIRFVRERDEYSIQGDFLDCQLPDAGVVPGRILMQHIIAAWPQVPCSFDSGLIVLKMTDDRVLVIFGDYEQFKDDWADWFDA